MAFGHRHRRYRRRGRAGHRYAIEPVTWSIAAVVCTVLGSAPGALAKGRASLQPYGTDPEVRQCVANMEASLHGRSILGSRDTAAYIHDRGYLEEHLGINEYDVMVDRCRTRFFHPTTASMAGSRNGCE